MKSYLRFSDNPLASRCIGYAVTAALCTLAALLITGA